jgi:hypothetical protein
LGGGGRGVKHTAVAEDGTNSPEAGVGMWELSGSCEKACKKDAHTKATHYETAQAQNGPSQTAQAQNNPCT